MRIFKAVILAGLALAAAVAQPVIKDGGVQNGGSYLAGIAPGSIFVVKGTGIGPATLIQAGALPYQTTLSNTSISFTPAGGGSAVQALMVYAWDKQSAALLPSSTAPGTYNVTVTYNGATSAPASVQVVARNFGFVTQSSNGQGPAQATYGGINLNRFTTSTLSYGGHDWSLRPAKPGEVVVLWGTGLGADTKSDVTGGTSGDFTAAGNVRVSVDGVDVVPGYAGRSSGTPGLDQINFTLPANVTPSCFVSVQVKGTGFTSNMGSIAVAPSGQNACSHPTLSAAQLANLDKGGTLVIGNLDISKSSTKMSVAGQSFDMSSESADGSFTKYTIGTIGTASFSMTKIGACYVVRRTGTQNEITTGVTAQGLDAGPQLTLNGPNASGIALPQDATSKDYFKTLYSSGVGGFGGQGTPTITQGTYTFTGPGGADIGAFTASIDVPGDFVWTNQTTLPDPISRSTPLNIQWTGGGTGQVAIMGISAAKTGGTEQDPIYDSTVFVCIAQATAGSFSVPTSVLQQLPAAIIDQSATAFGMLSVDATPDPSKTSFTAPHMDQGFIGYSIGGSKTTGWQ